MRSALAITVDSTFSQAFADLVLIALVALNAWWGWKYGLVRRAFMFAGMFAAVAGATYLGNPIASLLAPHDIYGNAWCFVLVFVAVIILFEIMAALFNDQIQSMIVITFDKVAGLIAGLLMGVFETGILFLVCVAVGNAPPPSLGNSIPGDYQSSKEAVSTATLGEYVVDLKPGLEALFGPSLPSDLSKHLAEGTTINGVQ